MPVYSKNLWQYFKEFSVRNEEIDMASRFKLFKNIISGLRCIQEEGFSHLDIKPSNILINCDASGKWNQVDCVITDFGIGGESDKLTGLAGTPGFASPEQLIGEPSSKSDNYSFGVLCIFIFVEWNTAWSLLYRPIKDDCRTRCANYLRDVFDVITSLLQVNPSFVL